MNTIKNWICNIAAVGAAFFMAFFALMSRREAKNRERTLQEIIAAKNQRTVQEIAARKEAQARRAQAEQSKERDFFE